MFRTPNDNVMKGLEPPECRGWTRCKGPEIWGLGLQVVWGAYATSL